MVVSSHMVVSLESKGVTRITQQLALASMVVSDCICRRLAKKTIKKTKSHGGLSSVASTMWGQIPLLTHLTSKAENMTARRNNYWSRRSGKWECQTLHIMIYSSFHTFMFHIHINSIWPAICTVLYGYIVYICFKYIRQILNPLENIKIHVKYCKTHLQIRLTFTI